MTESLRAVTRCVLISLLVFPLVPQGSVAHAADYEPGRSYFGRKEYIEYIAGNLPLVLGAPHGGYLKPSEIADRTWGVTGGPDTRSQELIREIGDYFEERTGRRPHIIINRLHRVKLDANRGINEAAQGDPYAEQAWREYHAFIEDAKSAVVEQCAKGHYFDIHTHQHDTVWVELGVVLGSSDLDRSDEALDVEKYKDKTSLRSLAYTPGVSFPEIVRGVTSLGGLLQAHGYMAIPSPDNPDPNGRSYYMGGYNTVRHGSRNGGTIDATQIETHYKFIKDDARPAYMRALVDSMIAFLETHYDFDFTKGGSVCPGAHDPNRPKIDVLRAQMAFLIDGRLNEIPRAVTLSFADQSGRGERDNQSSTWLLWDPQYLYVGIEVLDTQLNAAVTARDGPVWQDDAVEVFIDTEDDGGAQFDDDDFRFGVNLNGAIVDSHASWNDHTTWNGSAIVAVQPMGDLNEGGEDDRGYTLEIAIPWADLGIEPGPDRVFGLDVAVDDLDTAEDGYQYSDWADLAAFNRPRSWGQITLRDTLAEAPTFADVPFRHTYHDEIEALYRAGYTAGCGTDPLRFCPDQAMSRAESAVFVQRGVHGVDVQPGQPASQTFADLPLESWAARWAEALYADGYTAGCWTDPLRYCPWQGHTRAEGAVFYLRMLHGQDYSPPDPEGIFSDVTLDSWHAKWDEAAYTDGLIPACSDPGEPLRFCPDDPLTRGLAAYMMVQSKGLR